MEDVEELDLREIFDAFWKKKWILIMLIALGAIGGFLYTKYLVEPTYRSSATLILSKPVSTSETNTLDSYSITQADITLNQKLISTYGELMKSKRVLDKVIDNLKLNIAYEKLIKCVSVTAVEDTDLIKISVTTDNAKTSANVVNELVNVFSGEVVQIYDIQNVSLIDPGEVDNAPVNINYIKTSVVFALIFFVIGAATVFAIYYFDNSIKSKEEIEKYLGIPVLAVIPKIEDTKEDKKKCKN